MSREGFNKNFIKKILTAITVGNFVTPISCLSVVSCNNDKPSQKIEAIALDADQYYVFNGGSLQINKTITPAEAQNNPVVWEMVAPLEGVSITEDGVVQVEQTAIYSTPVIAYITAYDPTDETIFDVIEIAVTTDKQSNFLGFAEGNLYCKDRYLQDKTVKIVKKNENEYETEDYIDFFANDQTSASNILFVPLFKKRVNTLMKFHLVGGTSVTHGLKWNGYEDDSWTETIPKISPITAFVQSDVIQVSFACDPNIVFNINCWIWAQRGSISTAHVSYTPSSDEDIHNITPVGVDGKYAINVYWSEQKKIDTLGVLSFYKPLYEYLDLNFYIDYETLDIALEIREIMQPQLEGIFDKIEFKYREFDHFPSYELAGLSLDFSNEIFNPESYDYNEVPLFTLYGRDPLKPNDISFTLDFYLNWM